MASAHAQESAHDVLRGRKQPLDAFFAPRTVAVIGATETAGSVGRTVLANLQKSAFPGELFPINPRRPAVLGLKAYPRIAEAPSPVDLAVIVTPAATVPGVVRECVAAGVGGAIIISAGFKECGSAGADLEKQVRDELARGAMRVIGPNCLGVMSPRANLNATFAAGMVRPGNVAFLSQSGALLTAILDWSLVENVGFSAFVSIGSMLDVGWGDLIDYFGDDPHTHSIVLYMESIGNARAFVSAAREVTLRKPVIVIKAGRTEAAAKAAASHTGSLSGSDDVLEAAFRRSGVLRVSRIADLFHMAEVLSKQPRPKGPRLTILTNAGGPAVLATDALIGLGGELTPQTAETLAGLNQLLPPQWSHSNPIDILGDAGPERYGKAVEIAARDPNSDGLLVILTPQDMTDPTQTAEHLKSYAHSTGKPILASWMGGAGVAAGVAIFNRAGIPTFSFPDTAARVFNYMWHYTYNLRGLYETPALPAGDAAPDRARADALVQEARRSGGTLLTEFESKQLLAAYRIATVPTHVATSEAEAVRCADALGYPVVLKLHSLSITHKTDVGGVKLNLADAAAVRRAYQQIETAVKEKAGAGHFAGVAVQPMVNLEGYEIILGSSADPQFGPVLLFGTGGQLVEVFKDRALALPPLNTTLARRMMEQTKIFTAFKGVRGRKPVDLAALEQLLVNFSQLVVEQRWIKEIDINPLLVSAEQIVALDARVVLYGPDVPAEQLPPLAIRPYPVQYVSTWTLKDGTAVTIRPIRPEDETLLVKFHETLSEQTVYQRYLHAMKLSQRVAHDRLSRLCFIDYDRELALVAERSSPLSPEGSGAQVHPLSPEGSGPQEHPLSPEGRGAGVRGAGEVIAVGRLIKLHGGRDSEFALLVSDRFQRSGLGTELLRRLVQVGRDEHIGRIHATLLPENAGMRRICEKLGFHVQHDLAERVVKAELTLA